MRIHDCLLILVLLLPAPSAAAMQAEEAPLPPQRDGFAFGLLATPALEGGGPWFMPAIRVSAPLGPRHAVDFDSGVIFLATSEFAEIKSFLAAQLRFARARPETSTTARYWLAGLRYVPITKPTGDGSYRRTEDLSILIGHGWKETFANGTRVLSEIGFAGGSGFMAYVTIGVQLGARQ